MTQEKKQQIIAYLQNQLLQAEYKAKAYVYDENNKKNPKRDAYDTFNDYLKKFLKEGSEPRWLMIPGLRGIGKTTILSQMYHELKEDQCYKLYLSVDQATQMLNTSLQEILIAYEELIGTSFERLKKPLFLFLDEIQYEPKWGITLKTTYDRSKKIFIVATGSSALLIQANTDIVRRAVFKKLYPMSFSEYISLKEGKKRNVKLCHGIRQALYDSHNAQEVYDKLADLKQKVNIYWTKIDRLEVDRYLRIGTLPFALKLNNEGLVYDQIKKMLDRIVSVDIRDEGKFKPEIVSKVPAVLYTIAGADVFNIIKASSVLSMNNKTIMEILSSLEKSEALLRVMPYGQMYKKVRKPSKYLFCTPAFRSMYFNFLGGLQDNQKNAGKLLEDCAAMYFTKFLEHKVQPSLTYDSAEGGADFILRYGEEQIIIEIGHGYKGYKQVQHSAKRIKSKYNLSIAQMQLSLSEDKQSVTVPLQYFLLL